MINPEMVRLTKAAVEKNFADAMDAIADMDMDKQLHFMATLALIARCYSKDDSSAVIAVDDAEKINIVSINADDMRAYQVIQHAYEIMSAVEEQDRPERLN